MKKILAIILVSAFTQNAFAAVDPEIFLGGSFNFNGASTGQSSQYSSSDLPHNDSDSTTAANNQHSTDQYFSQEAHLELLAVGKSDSGLLYGGRLLVAFDSQRQNDESIDNSTGEVTYTDNSKKVYTEKSYIFLEKEENGRVELGSVEAPSKKMKFDASYRAGGTGGLSGDWWKYINVPSFGISDPASGEGNKAFIIRPDLPIAHGYSWTNGANKFDDTKTITRAAYYTPRNAGLQFGVSYAPDSGDRGSSHRGEGFSGDKSKDIRDIVDWGVNYVDQYGALGVGVSITGEIGYAENTGTEDANSFVQQDVNAYALGGYMFYGNLSAGASYGQWNDSAMHVKKNLTSSDAAYRSDEASYYTLGLGYDLGPYKLSTGYMESEYREQNFTLWSSSIDYKVAKGLRAYVEYSAYDFAVNTKDIPADPLGNANTNQAFSNSGHVAIAGVKFTFGELKNVSKLLLDTTEYN
jgi:hypothetical protein